MHIDDCHHCLNCHLSEHVQETRSLTLLWVCFTCWRLVSFVYVMPSTEEENYTEAQQGDFPVCQCFSQNWMHRKGKNDEGEFFRLSWLIMCSPCICVADQETADAFSFCSNVVSVWDLAILPTYFVTLSFFRLHVVWFLHFCDQLVCSIKKSNEERSYLLGQQSKRTG